MSAIAIIPARGGSKRIPRKNIREFMGKPMVSYAISAALKSGVFDEVMVSTDDEEIADIARRYGAAVPFLRSATAASDSARTRDVIEEVIGNYRSRGRDFDRTACIYPCVPLMTEELLCRAWRRFEESGAEFLLPVVRYPFPVQRALIEGSDGQLVFREPEHTLTRTQDLEPAYHDAGMFYLFKTDAYLAGENFRRSFFEMPSERVQDIDSPADWRMAELKYKLLNDVQDRA